MLKRLLFCLTMLTLAVSLPARAQTIVLDGRYVGRAYFGGGAWRVTWGLDGVNSDPGSTLASVDASEEGEAFPYSMGYFGVVWGTIHLNDGNGNGLGGFLDVGGWLDEPWEGTFSITNGTGRYAGYTGGGTVTVAALDAPNPNYLTALTLKGSAGPPIPEPSTLFLLGSSGFAGLIQIRRRRTA